MNFRHFLNFMYFYGMIEFILNNSSVHTDLPPGMSLLDFIRGEMGLTGTKTGCREGDCGACTVMLGELAGDKVRYKTIVSCLTPLGNVHAMHVVTIEGLNSDHLSPVQQAIVDHSGTQCGFCTPGFVMSLMTHSLSDDTADFKKTIASIDGNICRCTGYKSIERAAKEIWELNQTRNDQDAVSWMVKNKHLPDYFSSIPQRLSKFTLPDKIAHSGGVLLSGGTDLMVQQADVLFTADLNMHMIGGSSDGIKVEDGYCIIDARTTAAEIAQSAHLQSMIPGITKHLKLVSSTQIRNMGTLGGNIVNASPIGDLTILLMALDAGLLIANQEGGTRELRLSDFYTGYKQFDLREKEHISSISFRIPDERSSFNFEKVSKREHLDIASVNTAILIKIEHDRIADVHLSAGGIAAIPMYLKRTCKYLQGRKPDIESILEANMIMQEEISPISDIRGSEEYKRLLLRQLLFAHFIELFPDEIDLNVLLSNLHVR